MIIVYKDKKRPFIILGKKKSGSLPDEPEIPDLPDLPDGVLPEVAENEDILVIKNVDTVEGTVFMNNPNNIAIQYSTNGSEFNDYTTETEVPIKPSDKVYFKWREVIGSSSNSTALVQSSVKYKVYGELKKGNEQYAYTRMFKNESNLIDVSELKLTATTLANYCYQFMFYGCRSLTTAPSLPATELANYCYDGMFSGCSSLTTAPELPATVLGQSCYSNMFTNCTSLTTAPSLPATVLESSCYMNMFSGCTSLTTAPELPATELESSCYWCMFQGCTSLTTAPELPATELASTCYFQMFSGCSKLNYVKHYITEWSTSSTTDWLSNVSANGTVECPANSTIQSNDTSGIPTGWIRVNITDEPTEPEIPDLPDGVLPEVAENEDILAIKNVDTTEGTVYIINPNGITIQYSTNGSEFNEYIGLSEIPIKPSDKVYFKWSGIIGKENNSTTVSSNVKYKAYGELKKGNESYAYRSMFRNETNLIDASELKLTATTLGSYCYNEMFIGCTSLTTTPELPATTLANGCYWSMFRGCTALTTAPSLPATTLANTCYDSMFRGCTALTTAPALAATTLANTCYQYMFRDCTALTTAPELPATELRQSCYGDMFNGCSSLTTAPQLPATTLANYCYNQMFRNCTALTTAPALPATELTEWCYFGMFYNCSLLNYVKHNIINWDINNTIGWLSKVSANGTVECPANSTIPSNDTSGIPTGWIRVNITDEPSLPEVAENEDILAIENVDTTEGTVKMNNPYNKTIQYSTNGESFNKYTTASEISIGIGEKVYFKWSDVLSTSNNQNKVNSTVKYKVYGELKQGNESYAYYKMFINETNLIDASKLKLPATILAEWCYSSMFSGCSSLTTAPELPATVLGQSCYSNMFTNCRSLTTAPSLPATTLKTDCYNCMFQGCTSLTTAPELPATKLASTCYYRMFKDCTNLNYVKHHIVSWSTSNASNWLSGVASSGTMYCPLNSTISSGTSGIPTGWLRVAIE